MLNAIAATTNASTTNATRSRTRTATPRAIGGASIIGARPSSGVTLLICSDDAVARFRHLRHPKRPIHPDQPRFEAPLAADAQQRAFVFARRQKLSLAATSQEVEQVASGARPVSIDFDAQVRQYVAKLRALLALEPRGAFGEIANAGRPGKGTERRAVERSVLIETADHG